MDFTIPITIQQFRVPIILFCHRMQIAVIIAALNVGAWEQHHCLRLILWTLRRGVINVPTAKWFKTVWACLSVSMADIRTATEPYFRCAIPFASERRSTEWCFSIKIRSAMMPHITAETEHGITWIKGEHSWTLGLIFCAVLFQHWFFSLFLSLSLFHSATLRSRFPFKHHASPPKHSFCHDHAWKSLVECDRVERFYFFFASFRQSLLYYDNKTPADWSPKPSKILPTPCIQIYSKYPTS